MSSIEFQRRDSVSVCEPMYYERPRFNLNKIDKAGICLRGYTGNDDDIASALEVMFNYRASHSFPLNLFYTTLRRRAKKIDPRALTAQRLKRFESIFRKLRRRETMQLSQMQDIGGCRAIVNGVKQLGELVDAYKVKPLIQHGMKDYTKTPKDDGYRSVHLMYRFTGSSTSQYWDKLRIEIQMRTKIQHAWATAGGSSS
jgi:ppGpp synthetase/RelA/SpoT-type nucleotidyltranferase